MTTRKKVMSNLSTVTPNFNLKFLQKFEIFNIAETEDYICLVIKQLHASFMYG